MKKKIKYLLAGHSFPQEYLCLDEHTIQPRAYFMESTNEIPHVFLGYKPVIMATHQPISQLEICQDLETGKKRLGTLQFTPAKDHFQSAPEYYLSTGTQAKSYLLTGIRKK